MQDKKFLKRQQAAEKLLKKVPYERLPMCGAHIVTDYDDVKYQCFTNGYIGFMLNEELPDLHLAEPYNMVKMIRENEQGQYSGDVQGYSLDVKDIKSVIKAQKEKNKTNNTIADAYYVVGNHTYNAQYLLDAIEILGGEIQFQQNESTELTPGILKSENGKAIVLPIRSRR